MPLASASPPRSAAIGAGVGGKVSHRSAAKGQRYTGDERGEGELAHELLRKETIQRLYTALSAAGHQSGRGARVAEAGAPSGEKMYISIHAQPLLPHRRSIPP